MLLFDIDNNKTRLYRPLDLTRWTVRGDCWSAPPLRRNPHGTSGPWRVNKTGSVITGADRMPRVKTKRRKRRRIRLGGDPLRSGTHQRKPWKRSPCIMPSVIGLLFGNRDNLRVAYFDHLFLFHLSSSSAGGWAGTCSSCPPLVGLAFISRSRSV